MFADQTDTLSPVQASFQERDMHLYRHIKACREFWPPFAGERFTEKIFTDKISKIFPTYRKSSTFWETAVDEKINTMLIIFVC